jgi:hypothetical protein
MGFASLFSSWACSFLDCCFDIYVWGVVLGTASVAGKGDCRLGQHGWGGLGWSFLWLHFGKPALFFAHLSGSARGQSILQRASRFVHIRYSSLLAHSEELARCRMRVVVFE